MAAEPSSASGAPQFVVNIPFSKLLGLTLLRHEDGLSELAMEVRPELCNSFAVAHGGAVMTLLDVAMAHAARNLPKPGEELDRRGMITIEMKTSFMGPATGRVVCRGKRLRATRSFSFCQAELFNDQGELLAMATGTFKYRSAAAKHPTPTEDPT